MADMPTIYPMRFPSVPAPRMGTNIDDLLPSTYMDRQSPFTGAMQQVGKMLQAKQSDLDEANTASMKYGPTAAPGQIAALNSFLFSRGGSPYSGVMNQDGTQALQVPGGDPATPFNTAGQVGAQTNAEQAAALKFKQDKDAATQAAVQQKLDMQQKQFEERSQQRADELKEKTAYHEHTNARLLLLGQGRMAQSADAANLKRAADVVSKKASMAFQNGKAFAAQASALEKAMANDFSMSPEVKAQRQVQLQQLHDQADSEMKRGWDLDSQTNQYIDEALGQRGAPAPAPAPRVAPPIIPKPAPQAEPTNPRFPGAKWGTVGGVPGWYAPKNGALVKVE